MKNVVRHPAVVLAVLGAVSGGLGAQTLSFSYGDAPRPGFYMILTGIWFGVVVGFGTWQFGTRLLVAVAAAIVGTWIGWEVAVNLAMQITENWLKTAGLSERLVNTIAGSAAGAAGALLTWAGVAACTPQLRKASSAGFVGSTGALLGLLLPLSFDLDSPALLLVPWQFAVAGVLGLGLASPEISSDPLPPKPIS